MSVVEIEVAPREALGKGGSRKLRAEGKVPAVLYGHRENPAALTLDPHLFFKQLRSTGFGRNTLFKLKGLAREVTALVKDMQQDPVRWDLIHLDFVEVRDGDSVVVEVPVKVSGRAAGVIAGGSLAQSKRSMTVRCSPFNIPKSVDLDVTKLQLNDVIRVSDITLPDGAVSTESGRLAVVAVKESRASRQQAAADAQEAAEGKK